MLTPLPVYKLITCQCSNSRLKYSKFPKQTLTETKMEIKLRNFDIIGTPKKSPTPWNKQAD